MIIPQDEATLRRITGRDSVPEIVEQEYRIRIRMYHSAGASGPLGIIGCIDLVRSLGLMPATLKENLTDVDWRKYQQDGTVKVEVGPFYGQWLKGVFVGFAPAGSIAVRLTEGVDAGYVKELRKSMVRLVSQDMQTDEPVFDDPRKEGLAKEKARAEVERQRKIREENDRLRAAKHAAELLKRSQAWSDPNQQTEEQRMAAAHFESVAESGFAIAEDSSVAVAEPPAKTATKKPAGKKKKQERAIDGLDAVAPQGEVEYKQYIPPSEVFIPGRANLEKIKELKEKTPIYVAIGEGEEVEHADGLFIGIQNDAEVIVQLDGSDETITVAPETITLLD
jgi:hypothetical protein